MKNKIQEFIDELEARTDRSEQDDKLLEMLLQKQKELGENPSAEEAEFAARQVIKEHLLSALRQKSLAGRHSDEDEDNGQEDGSTTEGLEEEITLVREAFRKMDLRFRDYHHHRGVHAFELNLREDGKRLRLDVYLEASPKTCRMDAVYPFTADQELAYPLCEKLVSENLLRRYGALQYDARDGELSYRYSFPITHGLHKDDFQAVFWAVVKSAMVSFDAIRPYANGRFRREDRQQIISNVHRLLNEIDS